MQVVLLGRRRMAKMRQVVKAVLLLLIMVAPLGSVAVASPTLAQAKPGEHAPSVQGEFLIKFKPNTQKRVREDIVSRQGGRIFDRVAQLDVEAVEFPALKNAALRDQAGEARLMEALTKHPDVAYIEPNMIYRATWTPNDPFVPNLWGLSTTRAYEAWNVTRGNAGVIIAVVDSGVQQAHPDLAGKIVSGGYDYIDNDSVPEDGNGHGTHVAGTAAAITHNSYGVAGMCPHCRILPVRVLNNANTGSLAGIANGILFAAQSGAKVINLSLNGGNTQTMLDAVNYAWNQGSFLACAAGNNATNVTTNAYPAAYTNCFAVASTNGSDQRSSYSNYGSWVTAAAPGEGIYSTWLGSSFTTMNGTSMATPHVAGLAGLLSAQGLTNAQIRARICGTADQIAGTGSLWACGRINAYRAVRGGTSNLYAVAKYATGSGTTEVHVLNGANNFQSFVLNVGTPLGTSGRTANWTYLSGDYNGDGIVDVIGIFRSGTGSGMTEVHVLSGATNFQTFLLQTATVLGPTGNDGTWMFDVGDYNRDGFLDIFAVAKAGTGSGKTEVTVLNGATTYQSFLLGTATVFPQTGTNSAWMFRFGDYDGDGYLDMYGFAKSATGSGTTEVLIANGANNFQSYRLSTATALGVTGNSPAWQFDLGDYNHDGWLDVYAFNKNATASATTEVFVLNGANNFQSFLLQTATALSQTGADWAWQLSK